MSTLSTLYSLRNCPFIGAVAGCLPGTTGTQLELCRRAQQACGADALIASLPDGPATVLSQGSNGRSCNGSSADSYESSDQFSSDLLSFIQSHSGSVGSQGQARADTDSSSHSQFRCPPLGRAQLTKGGKLDCLITSFVIIGLD